MYIFAVAESLICMPHIQTSPQPSRFEAFVARLGPLTSAADVLKNALSAVGDGGDDAVSVCVKGLRTTVVDPSRPAFSGVAKT
jgi:hypothetical protein